MTSMTSLRDDGMQSMIDVVKRSLAHYEQYRCICSPGLKAHTMQCDAMPMRTREATFATFEDAGVQRTRLPVARRVRSDY